MAKTADERSKTRNRNKSSDSSEIDRRLEELGDRLGKTRAARAETAGPSQSGRAMAVAIRAVTELIVSILVGSAIGWGLDWWLGTSPFMLLVFILLGFAAGTLNVVRATGHIGSDEPGAER